MKLIKVCPHVQIDQNEEAAKWGNRGDDGTYTIITRVCQECFLAEMVESGDIEDLPIHYLGDSRGF